MRAPRPDSFISADIETDGPIPGAFSMLSFGLCVAGRFDGEHFERWEHERRTFYVELKPVSEQFEPEALAVNGLDRNRLLMPEGADPAEAMHAADRWVREQADGARPVLVAYPVAFDWAFLYWYFVRFAGRSPFGFSSCLDIRTLYQARALTPFDNSSQRSMPHWLLPGREHTHNAADDALEQAELFSNIFEWALKGGGSKAFESAEHVAPNWMAPMLDPYPDLPPPGVLGSRELRRQHRYRVSSTRYAPDRIRTCDLRFRRPTLYPTELRARVAGLGPDGRFYAASTAAGLLRRTCQWTVAVATRAPEASASSTSQGNSTLPSASRVARASALAIPRRALASIGPLAIFS